MRTGLYGYFAETYGACAYGDASYQAGTCTNSTNTGTSAGSGTPGNTAGGLLTNTGFDILLAATVACTIMFVALLVRFWKRPASRSRTGSQ